MDNQTLDVELWSNKENYAENFFIYQELVSALTLYCHFSKVIWDGQ